MSKKGIKDIVDKAKEIVARKDGEISLLKNELRTATREKQVTFKMPDTMSVTNFPAVQKVHIENAKDTQDVHVLNLKDIKIEKTTVKFPDVQDVRIVNPTDQKGVDKASGWVPTVVAHAVKVLSSAWANRLDKGIEVFHSDEDKVRPQAVVVVDVRGRPVDLAKTSSMIIPMPGGGSTSGNGPRPASTITSSRKTVTTPGTAVKLISSVTPSTKVILTAPGSNGGFVYVGGSTVSAVAGSEMGLLLTPTGSVTLDIDDVSKVWIDAEVGGEGVTFSYIR